jgi:hypothetical protein
MQDSEKVRFSADTQSLTSTDMMLQLILNCIYFYPRKKTNPPPIVGDPHWRPIYEQQAMPLIEGFIIKQVQRSAGRSKVAGIVFRNLHGFI